MQVSAKISKLHRNVDRNSTSFTSKLNETVQKVVEMRRSSFEDRLQRIGERRGKGGKAGPVAWAGDVAIDLGGRQSLFERLKPRLFPIVQGLTAGVAIAILLHGLTMSGSVWGPDSDLFLVAGFIALFGLSLAPLLPLRALIMRKRHPKFLQFSVSYCLALCALPLV